MPEAHHILLAIGVGIVLTAALFFVLFALTTLSNCVYVARKGVPLPHALAQVRAGHCRLIINRTQGQGYIGVLWLWPDTSQSDSEFDLEGQAQVAMHLDEAKPVRVFLLRTAERLLDDPTLAGRVVELNHEAFLNFEEVDDPAVS
jgi:hypothetical protein